MRGVDRPDLLDVVEGPHLGPEQVDDDVAGVDQNPVAVGQALDAGLAVAGFLQGAQQVISDGADMAMRPSRRHDHGVSDGTFAFEINVNDVLGLVVIKPAQDQILETGVLVSEGLDGFLLVRRIGNRIRMRVVRGRGAQLNTPGGTNP